MGLEKTGVGAPGGGNAALSQPFHGRDGQMYHGSSSKSVGTARECFVTEGRNSRLTDRLVGGMALPYP